MLIHPLSGSLSNGGERSRSQLCARIWALSLAGIFDSLFFDLNGDDWKARKNFLGLDVGLEVASVVDGVS